ncbi:MAG: sulfocyanin-like copper-binding protein [Candidatus Dormiibacterota bacterium]
MRGAGPSLVDQTWQRLRRGPVVLGGLAISLSLAAVLTSCGGSPSSSADTGVGCSVTVQIPSSGSTLLGSVRTRVAGQTYRLARNISTVAVPCGDQVSLSATAAFPSQHPFTGWTVGGQTRSSAQLKVTVDGLVSVGAAFFVPHAAPGPSPTPSASPSATPSTVTLDQWVSYDSAAKTVTWKVEAGYQGVNHGLSFDGEADGAMKLSVPSGWSVTVNFSNVGTTNHSAVIVTATGTTPVFPGAETPSPMMGTAPGQSATFTFAASQVGSYRLACLMPGHEAAGMWETFTVTSGGVPSVQL